METLTTILFEAHSGVRWLVTAGTVLFVLYMLYAWMRRDETLKNQRVVTFWTILLDIQATLGIILLFLLGINGIRMEHAAIMIVAVIIAHLSARWKGADTATWARNNLAVAAVVLLLVFVGVARLPQGWLG
jgi:hypothetical protein